jgi:hypothetical protein
MKQWLRIIWELGVVFCLLCLWKTALLNKDFRNDDGWTLYLIVRLGALCAGIISLATVLNLLALKARALRKSFCAGFQSVESGREKKGARRREK